jgi:3'(2'), 5'-bisphosphate nucleotidase
MRSAEDSHTNAGAIDALAARLGIEAEPVRMDSQAKYAVLAAGGGELLFRLLNPGREDYKECIWDQAAGAIILEEAGGRITDLKGRPLDFTRGRKLTANTGVFASNGPLHEAGLEAIAEVCTLP